MTGKTRKGRLIIARLGSRSPKTKRFGFYPVRYRAKILKHFGFRKLAIHRKREWSWENWVTGWEGESTWEREAEQK